MSKTHYLWNHTEAAKIHNTFIYLNEKGDKIIGTIVTDNKNYPYSETSVFNKGAYPPSSPKFLELTPYFSTNNLPKL